MNEAYQRESERQERRLGNEIFAKPTIKSVNDIKRVISCLDPSMSKEQQIPVSTHVDIIDNDGKVNQRNVQTSVSVVNKRIILLQAFSAIKARDSHNNEAIPINGTQMRPAKVNIGSCDMIIDRWLGGYRSGLYICWDLSDGYTYKYCIFTHRLFRENRKVIDNACDD